jgi:hypothetical protein
MFSKKLVEDIKYAIDNRFVMNILYDNKWSYYTANRLIAPLAIGKLSTSGRWAIRALQLNATSYSLTQGTADNMYRIYLLQKISYNEDLLKQNYGVNNTRTFNIPPLYRKNDRGLNNIQAQLSLVDTFENDIDNELFITLYDINDTE